MKTRLIKTLRDRFDIPKEVIPDDKILTMTNGSILRTAAELEIALSGFGKSTIKTLRTEGGRA